MRTSRRITTWDYFGIGALVVVAVITAVGIYAALTREAAPTTDASSPTLEIGTSSDDFVWSTVLGDDLSSSVGAAAPSRGYAQTLVRAMCWAPNINAQRGTGYTAAGQLGGSTYPDRIGSAVSQQTDVIVIQGSTNDSASRPDEVAAAATRTFDTIKSAAPNAVVVVVGPLLAPLSEDSVLGMRDALAGATTAAGFLFVDPIAEGWLREPNRYSDGLHPNDEGYKEIQSRLIDYFEKVDAPKGPRCG